MADLARYTDLEHMLGAYFHQDWDAEGEDWVELVRNYLRDSTPEKAMATADEVDRLLVEGDDDVRLRERLLREFGCYYHAHAEEAGGSGARAWLVQVSGMLRAAVVSSISSAQ